MNDLDISVFERDGQLWTTSLNVAAMFGKEHKHVIDAIENSKCSEVFSQSNFRLTSYTDKSNRQQKMYDLTRDGFTILAMGYTGSKAIEFKEKYITAFNLMERQLQKVVSSTDKHVLIYKKFTEELMEVQRTNHEILKTNQDLMKSVSMNVNYIGTRVDNVEKNLDSLNGKVETLTNLIPLKRRPVSKKDKKNHIRCVADCFFGVCPLCGEEQIVDAFKNPTEQLVFDHFCNRHEAALDKTWAICRKCNLGKSNGTISDISSRRLFDGYQERLRMFLQKRPRQCSLFEGNTDEDTEQKPVQAIKRIV